MSLDELDIALSETRYTIYAITSESSSGNDFISVSSLSLHISSYQYLKTGTVRWRLGTWITGSTMRRQDEFLACWHVLS